MSDLVLYSYFRSSTAYRARICTYTLIIFLILISTARVYSCPADKYQVKAHSRSGYVRSDGTIVKPTFVTAYCKDYSPSYLYLKDLFNNKKPERWPHPEETKKWTEDERQRLIDLAENLPEALFVKNLKTIHRMKKSKDFPNPATNADGIIVLYDTAFDKKANLERIFVHELAHQIFLGLSENSQLDYRRSTGWTRKAEKDLKFYWQPRPNGYVAEDGKYLSEEDFANNIEYYLYEPDKLKEVTPSAYKWINKYFEDKLKLKNKGIKK